MPRLLAARFESIGHPAARLSGLTLRFTGPDDLPCDSALWLRNGGGKSSILNLIFSLLRPSQREFLGSEAEAKVRELRDYVGQEDVATVCLLWQLDTPRERPARLLTGVTMEFSRPGELNRLFYAIRTPDGETGPTLETLPLFIEEEGRRYLRRVASLREELLRLDRPPQIKVDVAEVQRRWAELLDSYGLDPEVFGYQLKMNRREGAADEIFRFASTAEFADFLIDMVLPTEDADTVTENLRRFRTMVQRRPFLTRQREALERAAVELRRLAQVAAERQAAHEARRALAQALWALHGRLDATCAQQSQARDLASTMVSEEEARLAQAQAEQARRHRESIALRAALAARAVERCLAQETQADRDRGEAERQRRRLTLAERLAVQRQAALRAAELRQALEARLSAGAPLLQELRAAARALDQALAEETAVQEARAELLDAQQRAQTAAAEAKEARRREVAAQRARDNEQAQRRHKDIARMDQRLRALRSEGVLGEGETLAAALARSAARIQELHTAEEHGAAQRQAAAQALQHGSRAEAEAQARETQAQDAAEQVRAALAAAEADLQALRGDATLQAALEDAAPDLLALGEEAQQRLSQQSAASAAALLALRVEEELGARVLAGLEQRELLPAGVDAEAVQQALRQAGVPAFTGGEYLADNASASRAEALLRARPELGAGVVVDAADLPRSEALLSAQAPTLDSPVVVGTTAALLAGAAKAAATQFTVPPRRALYDRTAALHERDQRQREAARRRERIVSLSTQKQTLDALIQRLAGLLRERGPAFFRAQRERLATLSEREAVHRAEALAAAQQVRRAQSTLRDLDEEARRHSAARSEAARAQGRLSDLREQGGDEVAAWRREAEQLLAQVAVWEAEEEELAAAQRKLRTDLRLLERELRQQEHQRALLAEERQALARDLPASDAAPPQEEAPPSLEAARERHLIRRRIYEERTGGEALRGEVAAAERRALEEQQAVDRALQQAGLTQAEVETALRDAEATLGLVATQQRVAEACERCQEALIRARAERLSAEEARARAQAQVSALQRQHGAETAAALAQVATLPVEDLAAALEACEAALALAQAQAAAAEALAREATARRRAAGEAVQRLTSLLQRLDDAAAPLREEALLLPLFLVTPAAAALSDLGEAPALVEEVVRRLQHEGQRVRRLDDQAAEAARALWAFVAQPEQEVLPQQMRDRFSEPRLDLLLARVADYIGDVELYGQSVAAELTEVDQHRQLLATELQRITDPALQLLRGLERASLFPAWVAGWGGEPFIKVTLRIPETAAERDAVAAGLVDQVVQASEVPSGLRLVQRLLRELTRGEGLQVRVIKPEAVRRRPLYESIERLRSFSRGEQLTAAILLYCTLARLRALQRGGRKQATQVLILDNPIGTCSKPELVALQRDMAAAHGVQLIYTTGVEDLEALARLPNTIRLQNAHVDLRGRLQVTLTPETPGVQAARIARQEVRGTS